MNNLISKSRKIFEDFKDKKYRDAYVGAHINDGIAFQIKAMRKRLGWSQGQLAKLAQTKQSAISRLENPDYGRPNIETLKKLASVFDVALMVRFIPFSELANKTANMTFSDINVPSYKDDHELHDCKAFDGDRKVSSFNSFQFAGEQKDINRIQIKFIETKSVSSNG